MIKMIRLLVSLAVLITCSNAYAIDMDFYTYDGFDQVVNGFERVALVVVRCKY